VLIKSWPITLRSKKSKLKERPSGQKKPKGGYHVTEGREGAKPRLSIP